ncbi:neuronal acetylcholine receptor subunit beta-3-like [Physella acuta]|uniref:neuronal acetylcholine receptor subunit beta-3-like n=1 Tax=Physella acuta TaxID=109671 RepID=UPI0027DBAF10|nr:neuronal acetylcholine receptor subunit beta-3-like [Physella acuta]
MGTRGRGSIRPGMEPFCHLWTTVVVVALMLTVIAATAKRNEKKSHLDELSWEEIVVKSILESYKMRTIYSRPVLRYNDTLNVKFAVQLQQIMGLNEQEQILTLNIWDQIEWHDAYISWKPEDYGHVFNVRIPCHNVWTPDIKLHNYADLRLKEHRDALCIVNHNGDIYHVPQVVYRSSCLIDVYVFPFDVQNCTLKFGSWTYSYDKLDLSFYGGKEWIDLTEYIESSSWSILDVPAYRHIKNVRNTNESRVELYYHIVFQRRSALYNYILILPCILLTTITLVLFFIPPESPAKMQLGLAIFIAFFVLLRLLEKNLPPGTLHMPLLGTYYCLNMILITLSSFLNVLIVDLTTHGQRTTAPPKVSKFFFNYLAKCLMMEDLVRPFISAKPKSRTPKDDIGKIEEKTWKHELDGSNEAIVSLQRDQTSQCVGPLAEIEHKLGELREFMKLQKQRIEDRDKKDNIAKQWKAVALILDRIFFFLYLLLIFASLSYTLPVLTWSNTSYNSSLVQIAKTAV